MEGTDFKVILYMIQQTNVSDDEDTTSLCFVTSQLMFVKLKLTQCNKGHSLDQENVVSQTLTVTPYNIIQLCFHHLHLSSFAVGHVV